MKRRTLLATLAVAATLSAGAAQAATEAAFTPDGFARAQQDGKPILVHVWASWCPTCAAQAPILAQIAADPANKDLLILKVDFDTQKDAVRALGARSQSTLVAFHGTTEKGRSAGDTNATSLKALAASAVQ